MQKEIMRKQHTDGICLPSQQTGSCTLPPSVPELATAGTCLHQPQQYSPRDLQATQGPFQQHHAAIFIISRAKWTAWSRLSKVIAALASRAASFIISRKDFHVSNHQYFRSAEPHSFSTKKIDDQPNRRKPSSIKSSSAISASIAVNRRFHQHHTQQNQPNSTRMASNHFLQQIQYNSRNKRSSKNHGSP
ncbi:hypothetical protein Nepgr_005308 [Nepenthes gracilis]|uniref:Uncharacterized protein n=1 Tax=Nepenthes gracilis TaxID=150966 RepID=A0AAD3S2Y4_NEPGR|nr:hypothetical protein Nepgr_005308 [Nepenthes gracilis]